MRSLLSKVAAGATVLFLAAAVAVSAPFGHPLALQSSARQPLFDPPVRHHVTIAPTIAPTTAVQPQLQAAPQATQSPARPAPVAPHIAGGGGQVAFINQDRAAAGLPPLTPNGCLTAIAAQNAARMAAAGYISHANGPTLDLGCHLGTQAGENVGYISNGVHDSEMNALFMNSPEHRANIMGPFHDVGVAWVLSPTGAAFIAVEFS